MTRKEITQLSYDIISCAIKVHKNLGPGLLESIYEKCLKYELEKKDYRVEQQLSIPIKYDDTTFDCNLKVDLLVNRQIVIELKTVETFMPIHEAQILTYIKLLNCPQGLLINFNSENISRSFKPFLNPKYNFLESENS